MEDAEAHYKLGMSFYRFKAMQEEDTHFIKASDSDHVAGRFLKLSLAFFSGFGSVSAPPVSMPSRLSSNMFLDERAACMSVNRLMTQTGFSGLPASTE